MTKKDERRGKMVRITENSFEDFEDVLLITAIITGSIFLFLTLFFSVIGNYKMVSYSLTAVFLFIFSLLFSYVLIILVEKFYIKKTNEKF